jgi:hypothetical protein
MNRLCLTLVGLLIVAPAFAQQHPLLDRLTEKVIQKDQSSSCEQLVAERQHPEHAQAEQRVIQMMRQNPQMRQEFLNRVAAPIANKLFECGMIP